MVTIIQAQAERHVQNALYGGFTEAELMALCGRWFGGNLKPTTPVKTVRVARIPTAAVCADCVAIARRWYAASYFEPFDCIQRRRLLDNLDRDLAAVA